MCLKKQREYISQIINEFYGELTQSELILEIQIIMERIDSLIENQVEKQLSENVDNSCRLKIRKFEEYIKVFKFNVKQPLTEENYFIQFTKLKTITNTLNEEITKIANYMKLDGELNKECQMYIDNTIIKEIETLDYLIQYCAEKGRISRSSYIGMLAKENQFLDKLNFLISTTVDDIANGYKNMVLDNWNWITYSYYDFVSRAIEIEKNLKKDKDKVKDKFKKIDKLRDIDIFLKENGYKEVRKGKGSHVIYKNKNENTISLPNHDFKMRWGYLTQKQVLEKN